LDKEEPKILILIQCIQSGAESIQAATNYRRQAKEFYASDLYAKSVSPDAIFSYGAKHKLVLSVLDNGIGIREDDQSKLFKLFGCLKSTHSMNTGGIGLGLVISKMISEEFGGSI